jgi:SAM-dependent methyltransferase
MSKPPYSGWDDSAHAWIASLGEDGDFGCRFVIDGPMIERIRGRRCRRALDIGCGEGRFCRLMQSLGSSTVGIDRISALIDRARLLDPHSDYRIGRAENLDVRSIAISKHAAFYRNGTGLAFTTGIAR